MRIVKRGISVILLCMASFVVSQSLAFAHHSYAMFDREATKTLAGTITEIAWQNPHGTIWITVVDDQGRAVLWTIQMPGPGALVRDGWKRSDLVIGDKIVAYINPLRDGRTGGSLVKATLADGRTLTETIPNGVPPDAPR